MADWSELPLDLLELISNLNKTSSDTRHFRSVCSYWRSSVPQKPPITHFLSPTIKFLSSQLHHLDLRLVKQSIFLLSLSSDPKSCWVIKTEEQKQGYFRLLSPFSKKTFIKHFDVLDLTNVNTLEIGFEYVLRNIGGNDSLSLYNMENEKVAFLGENDNFTLLSTHNSTGKLLMYRSNLEGWAFLDDNALGYDDMGEFVFDWSLRYVDVAEYKGRYYAVTDSGRTVTIEYGANNSLVVDLMVKSIIGGDKKYLVKSEDDLILVDLYTCPLKGSLEINAMDVYKLNKEEKKWVLLQSLEGRTIFLSKYSSFCTNNLVGLKENCIYFAFKTLKRDFSMEKDGNLDDNNGDFCDDIVESSEIGVFDYDLGSFEEYFEDSKLFCWPPPSWVNSIKLSH